MDSFDINKLDTRIRTLGDCKIPSPLKNVIYINPEQELSLRPFLQMESNISPISFELAGPRKDIFFDPSKTKAAIVTCGGICPGLNNVVRALVMGLYYTYGVKNILGIKYGLQGFVAKFGHQTIQLTPELVTDIHDQGGTILGTSRGEQNIDEIVDFLNTMNVQILFIIGGDGTLNAGHRIQMEIEKRGYKIAVVGIPKTIDNDISYVSRSFGFDTAIEEATKAIRCSHVEAKASPKGIGLVKLMGRHSGFIAATAAMAQRDVNYVLIPEIPFDLEGKGGLYKVLEERLEESGHAVVVVAEGAGQKFFTEKGAGKEVSKETDASGNVKLKDIGTYLKYGIENYFKTNNLEVNLKYIDPSYMIRSVPCNTTDGLFCANLGQYAVHAAMSGKTGMLVSIWHGVFCHIPIPLAISQKKSVSPYSNLWQNVMQATGQPSLVNF